MEQASRPRRARSSEAKQERAQRIVGAARELQAEQPFGELTMAAIARRAGLAKGTIFLYFATKEALGLALTEALLNGWFVDVAAELDTLPAPSEPRTIARLIAGTVDARPDLVRMLALLGTLLEHNVAVETMLAFKRRLLDRLDELGAKLERVVPFVAPGGGTRALLLIHALVVGLQQMAAPAPAAREALQTPELERLAVDLHTELELALAAYFLGLEAAASNSSLSLE